MCALKILSLNHKPPLPPVDGGTTASAALLEALALQHEVQILTYVTSRHPEIDERSSQLQQVPVGVALDGLFAAMRCCVGFALHRSTPWLLNRYRSARYHAALRQRLAVFKPDLVLIDGLPGAIWLDELDGLRVAYRSHNAEALILEERCANSKASSAGGWRGPVERALVVSRRAVAQTRALEKRLTLRCERVLAISEAVADYHRKWVEPRSAEETHEELEGRDRGSARVVSVPVPMASLDDAPPALPASVFHLGAMDWWPNQQGVQWFLEEVWPFVHEHHPGAKLHLAGRECRRWFDGLPPRFAAFSSGVTVDGEVDSAAEYIRSHGILVAPTLAGSGVKIKVLEALAQGRAVVTTSRGAEGLDVVHQEDLIVADRAADFSTAVSRLLSSPAERLALGRRALAYVERHHEPGKIAAQFDRLLA